MRRSALAALPLLCGLLSFGCVEPKPDVPELGLAGSGGSASPEPGAVTSPVPPVQNAAGMGQGAVAVAAPGAAAGSAPDPVSAGGAPSAFDGLRVAVISDLNDSYGSTTYSSAVQAAVSAVVAQKPDLVLCTGDMVAGQMAGLDYEGMWSGFHAVVTDVLEGVGLPLAVTPGNHDASGYGGFEKEREIFVRHWQAHKPDLAYIDDSHYPLRYSFSAGPALFVSLDDSTVGPLDTEQMQWLDAQLSASEQFPTKIVYGHVPLMPFSAGRETEIIDDPALEALLDRHGVTLFISGHHHAYYPGRRGQTRYVSTACLGAGPRPVIGTETAAPLSFLLFELDANGGITSLDALGGRTFDTPIDRASLPAAIESGAWRVTRDDL